MKNQIAKIEKLYNSSGEFQGKKIKKKTFAIISLFFGILAIPWGMVYHQAGNIYAATFTIAYSIITFINLINYILFKQFEIFYGVQIILSFLIPLILHILLGGFHYSGLIILWSLISPFIALLYSEKKIALRVIIGVFVILLLIGFMELYQPIFTFSIPLAKEQIIYFTIFNISFPIFFLFFILSHFIARSDILLQLLGEEKSKTESLLLSKVPEHILEAMKKNGQTISEFYEDITVIVIGVEGYKNIHKKLNFDLAIEAFNEAFSYMESIAEKHSIEKIGIFSDTYLFASGIPNKFDNHKEKAIKMSIEVRNYFENKEIHGNKISISIGISDGPVFAGVIGKKKLSYELIGDTVDNAWLLRSNASSGEILILPKLYEKIKNKFNCIHKGPADLAQKEKTEYWIIDY